MTWKKYRNFMPLTLQPVSALIRQRYSCRSYQNIPLIAEQQQSMLEALGSFTRGPFGHTCRFALATSSDPGALRGLGTYGFIRGAPAFIIGAAQDQPEHLTDFGYCMEQMVLYATWLGLGTCWLGGSFTRSSFAQRISAREDEIIPTVTALGLAAENLSGVDKIVRSTVKPRERLPWEQLFFAGGWDVPLNREQAGRYADALEMVRLGPSASNKQPWRVVKQDKQWHFYIQRTAGYRSGTLVRMLNVADMQRIDLGIAMCHFELAAAEAELIGTWQMHLPEVWVPELTEYVATWVEG
jgi:nitroreductase